MGGPTIAGLHQDLIPGYPTGALLESGITTGPGLFLPLGRGDAIVIVNICVDRSDLLEWSVDNARTVLVGVTLHCPPADTDPPRGTRAQRPRL